MKTLLIVLTLTAAFASTAAFAGNETPLEDGLSPEAKSHYLFMKENCTTQVSLIALVNEDVTHEELARIKQDCDKESFFYATHPYTRPTPQEVAQSDCLTKVALLKLVNPDISDDEVVTLKQKCAAAQ